MIHKEKALSLFNKGFHCSQSVLVAYANELDITEEQAIKISHCFNSGMCKGEVCGACSAALMVLGMKYGRTEIVDPESDRFINGKASEFMEKFKKENGSYICREIIRDSTVNCFQMVALAIDILEEMESRH